MTGGGALSGASEFLFIPPSPDFCIFSRTVFEGGGGGSFLGGGLTAGSAFTPGDLSLLPREGKGGGWLTTEPPSVETLLVDSRRPGNDGRDCDRLLLEFAVDGRDRDVCSCRLGGSGGSSASPQAGARTPRTEESIEVADVVLPALVEVEREASDATDSSETFREISEGLRGGNAGADCVEPFREGKGGGTFGFWPLVGSAGGGLGAGFC